MMPALQEIFEQGGQALHRGLRPDHVAHLAIDWQRLYCDPALPMYGNTNLQQSQKIISTLHHVNDFADAVRFVVPTWWVYHDPEITRDHFTSDYFLEMDAQTVKLKLAQFQEEGTAICGRVDPERDIVLRKPFKDAFAGTDLHERLQRHEIDTLLLTGLYRHDSRNKLRAESIGQTMRSAAELGYNVFIVEDLTVSNGDRTAINQLSLSQLAQDEGVYSLTADHVHRIITKYQP